MVGRFVILEHDNQGVHYDLMLEIGDRLRTWRLPEPPTPDRSISAQASFDHRLIYLNHEGPIGGNRGVVKRWERGVFSGRADGGELVQVELSGDRLCGKLTLRREGASWALSFEPWSG